MWQRRNFLKQSVACIATGAMLLTGAAPPRAATRRFAHRPFDSVLVDARYSDSRIFAAALRAQGAQVLDTGADLGLLWHGALGRAFALAPQRLAGLTPYSDLFICAAFAREHGAHLIYEGAHDCRGVECLTHSLRCGASLAGLGAALDQAGALWPERLAQQLGFASRHYRPLRRETVATRAPRAVGHPGMLYSWALA
jgi:hypothetical protein